jgi:hypothetical protein
MKAIAFASAALLCLCVTVASAQQPTRIGEGASDSPVVTLQTPRTARELPARDQFTLPSPSVSSFTPEMWLYTQEWRRHDDPAQAVRRNAEFRAEQRSQRLAAMKWYGFSNARPQASVTPFTGIYSPTWVGNGYDRYDWVGGRGPSTVLHVDTYGVLR